MGQHRRDTSLLLYILRLGWSSSIFYLGYLACLATKDTTEVCREYGGYIPALSCLHLEETHVCSESIGKTWSPNGKARWEIRGGGWGVGQHMNI